ncbi:MAG: SPOR domain-containing protein [Alkalispirochaeta sp.]
MKPVSFFLVVTTLLTVFFSPPLSAQTGGEATPRDGTGPEAYREALRRLEEETDSPRFADFLIDALRRAPDIAAVDDLSRQYLPRIENPERRGAILFEIGSLYELTNRIDRARTFYGQATQLRPGVDRYALAFARTTIETGNPDEAIIVLSRTIHTPDSYREQREAALLRTRAYALTGREDLAIAHAASLAGISRTASSESIDSVDIASLFLLGELATQFGRNDLRQEVIRRMEKLFPDAPETTLLTEPEGVVSFYPNPSRLIGTDLLETTTPVVVRSLPQLERTDAVESADEEREENTVTGIQTGSFRDRENAEYMVIDIKELGFSAVVREVTVDDGRFYRVIVPTPEDGTVADAQELVVRLKDRGIEGFLVFD